MASSPSLPDRLTARYRITEHLGGDRLAEAHLAKSLGVEGFEKAMVARVLAEPWRSSGVVLERVHAEATRAIRLSHANVVQLFDLLRGEDASGQYLVWMTEHVRGVTLHDLVARLRLRGRTLDLGLVLFLGGEIAKGLDHAHRRRNDVGEKLGALHGALEPRCVVISFEGTVKVADFGIARPLVELAGERGLDDSALPWASPACRRGERAGIADDVYSFGAVLRAIATTSTEAGHPEEDAWEDLPNQFRAFLTQCLHGDPSARPSSAAALHEELDALAYELGLGDGASELSSLVASAFADEASIPLPTWAAQSASSSLLRAAPRASLFPRRELHAAFTGALRAASQRKPQVLVVRGEPGSGVSTALRQELDRLEAPARACLVRTPDDFSPAGRSWPCCARSSVLRRRACPWRRSPSTRRCERSALRTTSATRCSRERASCARPRGMIVRGRCGPRLRPLCGASPRTASSCSRGTMLPAWTTSRWSCSSTACATCSSARPWCSCSRGFPRTGRSSSATASSR